MPGPLRTQESQEVTALVSEAAGFLVITIGVFLLTSPEAARADEEEEEASTSDFGNPPRTEQRKRQGTKVFGLEKRAAAPAAMLPL